MYRVPLLRRFFKWRARALGAFRRLTLPRKIMVLLTATTVGLMAAAGAAYLLMYRNPIVQGAVIGGVLALVMDPVGLLLAQLLAPAPRQKPEQEAPPPTDWLSYH